MANDCLYEMKIKGSKKAITRVINCLKTDYNYLEGKPEHKHFFRIFDINDEEEFVEQNDGTFTKKVYGYCAWSVGVCMLDGGLSYYECCKQDHEDIFMGTTLKEQSKDCEIEVFSEEEGCEFSEHYIYKNGECLCDDTIDIENGGLDDAGNFVPGKDIDWDTYEGDYACLNDHRITGTGEFAWTI